MANLSFACEKTNQKGETYLHFISALRRLSEWVVILSGRGVLRLSLTVIITSANTWRDSYNDCASIRSLSRGMSVGFCKISVGNVLQRIQANKHLHRGQFTHLHRSIFGATATKWFLRNQQKIGITIEMSRCWATTPKRSIRKYRITYFRFRTPKIFNVHERFSNSIGWSAVIEFLMRFKPIVEIHKSIVRRNCYSTTDMTSSVTDETQCQRRRRRRRPTVYSAQHYSACVSYYGQPSAVCTLRYDFCLLSTKAGNYHSDEPRGVPSKLLLLHNSSD